jgi:hypothetical protein
MHATMAANKARQAQNAFAEGFFKTNFNVHELPFAPGFERFEECFAFDQRRNDGGGEVGHDFHWFVVLDQKGQIVFD